MAKYYYTNFWFDFIFSVFYLATLIFAVYFVVVSNSRFIIKLLTVIGLIFLLFFSFQNEDMNDYIWSRVQWDSENQQLLEIIEL